MGSGERQEQRLRRVDVVRHRRPQREGRLPVPPARPAGRRPGRRRRSLAYRFNQGVPNAVSYYLPEMGRRTITYNTGAFVQDTWTHNRLTLQGALRYDRVTSYAPVEGNGTFGKSSFLNPQPITIQETPGVQAYNDITPRVGRRLRRVRERQDGHQAELGALPGVRGERLAVYVDEPRRHDHARTCRTAAGTPQWRPAATATWSSTAICSTRTLNGECAAAVGTARNLRSGRRGDHRRPGGAERLGRASERLSDHGDAAAPDRAARVGRRQLHAPDVPRVLRHRRPGPQRGYGVRDVYAHRTERSPAAERAASRSRSTR